MTTTSEPSCQHILSGKILLTLRRVWIQGHRKFGALEFPKTFGIAPDNVTAIITPPALIVLSFKKVMHRFPFIAHRNLPSALLRATQKSTIVQTASTQNTMAASILWFRKVRGIESAEFKSPDCNPQSMRTMFLGTM